MKTCFKCLQILPFSDFYSHKHMASGCLNKCKSCTKEDVRLYRQNNPEKAREMDRLKQRRYRQTGRYSQQRIARRLVRDAILRGDLVKQPCETCGFSKTEAHHPDYSQPLMVQWLCRECHRLVHLHTGSF